MTKAGSPLGLPPWPAPDAAETRGSRSPPGAVPGAGGPCTPPAADTGTGSLASDWREGPPWSLRGPHATHRSRVRRRRGRHGSRARTEAAHLHAAGAKGRRRTGLRGPPPEPGPRTERGPRGHLGAGPPAPRRGPWCVPQARGGESLSRNRPPGSRPSTPAASGPRPEFPASTASQSGLTVPARDKHVMAPAPEVPPLPDGHLETPSSERS